MGELHDKMARDLAIRNLTVKTQKEYSRCCIGFVRYHMRSPRELGTNAIKDTWRTCCSRGPALKR